LIPQDFLKAIATEHGVSDTEYQVLSQSIEGVSATLIAKNLGTRPEVIRNRMGEVYKKFHIPGAGPGKLAKLQQILVSAYQAHQSDQSRNFSSLHYAPSTVIESDGGTPPPRIDWNEAPDVSIFYGRTSELAELEELIVNQGSRLVGLLGMAGIGKTALSVKLAKQIQEPFEYTIWRSLRHAPSLKDLLGNLIQFFAHSSRTYLPDNANDRISLLIEFLSKHRCLLILDNAETILRSGELAGKYREGYEGYGELFRRIGESQHQSCLVITSQEKPEEIALLEGETLPVRSLQVTGLSADEAQEIFKSKGLADPDQWNKLVEIYQGNPLELKIAATTIQELFKGKVAEFLKHSTLILNRIRVLLEQQFERLSDLEKEIMYWLAIERKSVSLEQLQTNLWLPVSQTELFDVLESLGRRSLIENIVEGDNTLFTLQMVVMEYVTEQLIEQVRAEILEAIKTQKIDHLELVRSHAFFKSPVVESGIKLFQIRPLLDIIKDRLLVVFRSENKVEEQLNKIVALLPAKSPLEVGYAPENLQHLVSTLKKAEVSASAK